MNTNLRLSNPAQREYVGEIRALLAGLKSLDSGCRSEVARYILRSPLVDADIVLVGDSFSDPLPVHCFLRHRNGIRLADTNRVCIISEHVYEWWYHRDRRRRGVIIARIPVRELVTGMQRIQQFGRRASDHETENGDV